MAKKLIGTGGPGGICLIYEDVNEKKRPYETGTVKESVIRKMTILANKHKAINLSQGFPDFETPEEFKEAAIRALRDGFNQYSIPFGIQELREAIAAKAESYNHISADPNSEITVTCGATEGMRSSLEAVCNRGDEIIVFEPFHEMYPNQARMLGLNTRYIPIEKGNEVDIGRLASMFNPRTAAIIINTPHNPTGKVFSRQELESIAEMCKKHDAFAITDEIYEHILYDGAEHVSMASIDGMKERTLTVNAISKTASATGWRVGWAISPKKVTPYLRAVHDQSVIQAATPLQKAAVACLNSGPEFYAKMAAEYARRREIITEGLKGKFDFSMPNWAYYIFADFSRSEPGMNDVQYCQHLIENVGIATVPGSNFYSNPNDGSAKLRFAFCKKYETLEKAVEKI